MLFGDVYEKVK